VADEDVYDSRKNNRTDRWSLEEPAWQEAKYIVGHVTTLGLGLEVPFVELAGSTSKLCLTSIGRKEWRKIAQNQ